MVDISNSMLSGEEENHIQIQQRNNDEHHSLAISNYTGEAQDDLSASINRFVETLNHFNLRNLGYPTNQELKYDGLAALLNYHVNNAGDPFKGSSFGLNSTEFEVCVLDWFAKLWEIEKSHYWGYVTTGGTEGNLHGILIGREQLPDGILYASQDSHYSIFKIARMYRMQCVKVGTLISGEIDCNDLKALLLAHKNKPAIINLNIGTTMKGGVDDVDLVIQTLEECGFTSDRFYIHCDGALFGVMLPFLNRAPKITFKKSIGSVTISGHKFLGCPIPCGVVIARLKYINALSKDVEYIGSRDATITGSRCGHASIFLWYCLKSKGLKGLKKEAEKCIMNASYLHERLRGAGIGAMLNEFSNIVVFERPQVNDDDNDGFTRRWSLACEGKIAHVVVMQHVTTDMLDSFVAEFLQKRFQAQCIAGHVGSSNCSCSMHNCYLD